MGGKMAVAKGAGRRFSFGKNPKAFMILHGKGGAYAETREHRQGLSRRREELPRAERRELSVPRLRVRLHFGAVGIGEDHPPQHHRGP